jgi:aldehyde:ferredoxin oxidoreductase
MYGWVGTVLWVNLSSGKTVKQPLDPKIAHDFLGGRGFNSKILFENINTNLDPLSPENVLCLGVGPLTGTATPNNGRIEVSTLSPLSGILGDGNAGGFFPAALKFAGYDQIVITGRADKPKYLLIDNDRVELENASELWGRNVWETTDMLQERHGDDFYVAAIGQAGEHLVRFASIMFDKHSSAARGSGAVAGSKNFKAIAVRGTKKIEIASPKEFEAMVDESKEFFLKDELQQEIARYGSHLGMIRWWPGYKYFKKRLSPEEVPPQLRPEGWKKYEVGRTACYGCVVPCKNVYKVLNEIGKGLQFETIYCLGTNCGIFNPETIMIMGNLADKYGMDTISLGNVIAFAKQLYELGIITKELTGGLNLDWSAEDDQIKLIHQVAYRQGFGNIAAEGMYYLGKKFGEKAMEYCYHVKGLCRGPGNDMPPLWGIGNATSTRGADHLRGRTLAVSPNDKHILSRLVQSGYLPRDPISLLITAENACTLADSLGCCKGAVVTWSSTIPLVYKYPLWEGAVKLLIAVTGVEFNTQDLVSSLERIYAVERAFLVKRGIKPKHDRLPLHPSISKTITGENLRMEHERLLAEYYRGRGWDPQTGVPTREILERLGLKKVADTLESHEKYPEWDGPPYWPLERYHLAFRGDV